MDAQQKLIEMWEKKQKINVQLLSYPPPPRGGKYSNAENRREEGDMIVGKVEKYEIGEKRGSTVVA